MDRVARFEDAVCDAATDDASHVWVDGADYWIPRYAIVEDESEVQGKGDEGELVILERVAVEKGMV